MVRSAFRRSSLEGEQYFMPDNVLAFMIALGMALVLTPGVIAFARRTGALDKPDARKVHARPIPRIGGIGIYAAFMVSILVQLSFIELTPEFMMSLIGLAIGGSIIVALGIIDDYCDLPAKIKLLVNRLDKQRSLKLRKKYWVWKSTTKCTQTGAFLPR